MRRFPTCSLVPTGVSWGGGAAAAHAHAPRLAAQQRFPTAAHEPFPPEGSARRPRAGPRPRARPRPRAGPAFSARKRAKGAVSPAGACRPSPLPPGASAPRPSAAARAAEPCKRALAKALSDAAPEQPSRRNTQARAVPFTSRAEHQKPTQSAREKGIFQRAREGNFPVSAVSVVYQQLYPQYSVVVAGAHECLHCSAYTTNICTVVPTLQTTVHKRGTSG